MFKDMIKKMRVLINDKENDADGNQELIFCTLSCLANATFYEKQGIKNDIEYKKTKFELVKTVAFFAMQTKFEDICCEALRVISNLSRDKELVKLIIDVQLAEALVLLMESNSLEIVYYVLGALINLINNEEIK